MSKYGQIIENINFNKENFYTFILNYFGDLEMYKIRDEDSFSVYMTKVNTLLKNGNRYVVAIVQRDNNALDTIKNLSELRWVCFQTRTSDEYHNIPRVNYNLKKSDLFNSKITIKSRNKEQSIYTCENFKGIEITLLHTKGIEYEYPNEGTMQAALETFRTIITFN